MTATQHGMVSARGLQMDVEVDQIIANSAHEGIQTPAGEEAVLRDYANGRISRNEYLRRCGLGHLATGD